MSAGGTHPAGGVRLLSLPPELASLRDPNYETLSHAGLTPPPGPAFDSVAGVEATRRMPCGPPAALPGFRIEGVIGHGGMGSVYLARQLSLDRQVALKVMSDTWAADPVFVARFLREAYAAAQLNHPNVVQIYDIGEAGRVRYFSMEYVVGESLADVLKARGRLDTEVAVGYVLQAARGLKHAHDRGIVHRDIKPDNLLLDAHGTVKVADLGLVKTPDMTRYHDRLVADDPERSGLHALPPDMTGLRMALGTPAYMAPEQCRDAAMVDHRADVYSLGCTLYALVTGRQPFQARSAFSLMKKHAYEEAPPADQLNPRVPAAVAALVRRMMAKHPGERPADMAAVVDELERWLGVRGANGRFAAGEDHTAEVERLADEFREAPAALARQRFIGSGFSALALGAVLLLFFGRLPWAFGIAALAVQAAVAYALLNGHARQTFLYRRFRRFAAGMSAGDWLVAAGAVGLFAAFLWVSKLLVLWAGFGMLGAAAAGAVWYGLDGRVHAARANTAQAVRRLVGKLRGDGATDDDVHLCFAKHAGRQWEEFFEAHFGYEAKLATRDTLLRGGSAGPRDKFAAWREPLLGLLDRLEAARAAEREKRERPEPAEPRTAADVAAGIVVGTPTRAVLAALLIAAATLWGIQNEVWNFRAGTPTEPLALEGLPYAWTAWCDRANVGWGAMLLLASLFHRGHRMAALATLGAAVAAFGPKFGIRTVPPVQDFHVAMFLGTVLALVGFRLARR